MDAYLNYHFDLGGGIQLKAFINEKNITNTTYRASRLNRTTSGAFTGGFRQIIVGADVTI
jgi:Fe(3+) dicitrate transport protein